MANFLSKIAVNIKNLGKSKLDFSHAFSTTASFGDLQPVHCKLVQPDSNGTIAGKALVRFSTMLAPTFGKVKAKEYHHFVPVSDLFDCIPAVLSQSGVTNPIGSVTYLDSFPRMTLGLLSRLILIGARCEIFRHNSIAGGHSYKNLEITDNRGVPSAFKGQLDSDGLFVLSGGHLTDSEWFVENSDNPNTGTPESGTNYLTNFDGFHGCWFNLGKLNANWFSALSGIYTPPGELTSMPNYWIPIANNSLDECVGNLKEEYTANDGVVKERGISKHINPQKCDYAIDFRIGNNEYTLCFMLSSFGKRVRKQIIGSHKQVNMESYTSHEIVTLTALAKAYFDLFAVTQYENYEISPLRKFTRYVDAYCTDADNYNVDSLLYSDAFLGYILELGRMWYTEQQDAIGSMLTSTAVSPALNLSKEFIDVEGVANIHEEDVVAPSQVGLNGHAFIDAVKHGALDSEYLMKLYKWTNIHSVLGQAIEERLRAEGLGKYIGSLKSNFIGYHEELLDITDVVSTSDTYNNVSGDGKMLGAQGGRGIKLYKTKDCSWKSDEFGVVIGLLAIVPEADFLQAIDPQSYTTKKTDLILQEFDGMGFEAMRKTLLCGAINWASQVQSDISAPENSAESVVGLLPRGTHLKLSHEINNGDITLRSTMDGYLPFTLARYLKLGDYEFHKDYENTDGTERYTLFPTMRPEDVPLGGFHYRFLCKYPWLGNFNRIFANDGVDPDFKYWYAYNINAASTELGYELTHVDFDNFIVHGFITAPTWSKCKPISESFETTLEGEKPNASFEHA